MATIAITVLALRTTNVSRSSVTIAAWLLLPVCIARVLFGPHPLVIGYVYFLPLVLLTGSSLRGLFKSEREQNQPTNRKHRDTVLDN
ncbi:membrane protein [Rhodopirellula sallentina SM41]|uniref:Membrane protein n=1 Tax=Rhodopirellula sallentina SM41 TaxID=1263870 RepID=M5TZD0_9BACT|nr:membrane protein [Rhodopirellula sallentina SM41]